MQPLSSLQTLLNCEVFNNNTNTNKQTDRQKTDTTSKHD